MPSGRRKYLPIWTQRDQKMICAFCMSFVVHLQLLSVVLKKSYIIAFLLTFLQQPMFVTGRSSSCTSISVNRTPLLVPGWKQTTIVRIMTVEVFGSKSSILVRVTTNKRNVFVSSKRSSIIQDTWAMVGATQRRLHSVNKFISVASWAQYFLQWLGKAASLAQPYSYSR